MSDVELTFSERVVSIPRLPLHLREEPLDWSERVTVFGAVDRLQVSSEIQAKSAILMDESTMIKQPHVLLGDAQHSST